MHGSYGARELLVFAVHSGVPFVPLPYAGKVADFAWTVGIPTPALALSGARYVDDLLAPGRAAWAAGVCGWTGR